jgi:endonuclease/exonuclease/phosphatase family metal-dependent hydrolase
MDEVIDLERIAELIREVDPDLVALQEVDSVVSRTNGVDQATELGRLTSMTPIFGRFMPYQGGAYGMALLSRLELIDSANLRLPDGDEPRTSVSATVQTPNGRRFRFSGIHFYRTEAERMAQARALEEIVAQGDLPEILAGDFNSEPGGSVMTYLGELWTTLSKGEDRLTFSSFDPVREIDFVLVRPRDAFTVLQHRLMDEPVISDHRPVFTELVMR